MIIDELRVLVVRPCCYVETNVWYACPFFILSRYITYSCTKYLILPDIIGFIMSSLLRNRFEYPLLFQSFLNLIVWFPHIELKFGSLFWRRLNIIKL